MKIAEEFVTLFGAFQIHSAALINVRNGFDIDGRGVHVIGQYIRHFTDFTALHSQLVYQNLKKKQRKCNNPWKSHEEKVI